MPPSISPDKIRIGTARLILRIPKRGDEAAMASFYSENRQFLKPYSPTFSDELFSVRAWRSRIEATHAEYRAGRSLRLAVFRREELARVVGVANFTSVTGFPTYLCNLGYSIAESERGQGLIPEALEAAIQYVFTEMNLHRIEANYMPSNAASARVLEKLGFTIEGSARAYILIDGRWEDHVRTSLTNAAWRF